MAFFLLLATAEAQKKAAAKMRGKNRILLKSIIVFIALLLLSLIDLHAKEIEFVWNLNEPPINPNLFYLAEKANERGIFDPTDYIFRKTENIIDKTTLEALEKKSPKNFEPFHLVNREIQSDKIEFNFTQNNNSFKPKSQESAFEVNRPKNIERFLYNSSLFTLVILNIADYFSTKEAIKHEGLVESNPFAKLYVKNSALFTTVKIGWTFSNYFLMKKLYKKNKKLAWAVSMVSNFVMSYVVANNIKLINKSN